MLRLIICGSPRTGGRCASLANTIFEGCIAEFPDDEVKLVPISEIEVAGCTGCNRCNSAPCDNNNDNGNGGSASNCSDDNNNSNGSANSNSGDNTNNTNENKSDKPSESPLSRCAIKDDMIYVYENIEYADEIILVSPVYFSGAPSQLKALLDRLQPYYMLTADARKEAARRGKPFKTAHKPLTLHVVGEGDSPCGYDALVDVVRSAFAVAGFRLDLIADWVGKISESGEIEDEAQMYAVPDEAHNATQPDAKPHASHDAAPRAKKTKNNPRKK